MVQYNGHTGLTDIQKYFTSFAFHLSVNTQEQHWHFLNHFQSNIINTLHLGILFAFYDLNQFWWPWPYFKVIAMLEGSKQNLPCPLEVLTQSSSNFVWLLYHNWLRSPPVWFLYEWLRSPPVWSFYEWLRSPPVWSFYEWLRSPPVWSLYERLRSPPVWSFYEKLSLTPVWSLYEWLRSPPKWFTIFANISGKHKH